MASPKDRRLQSDFEKVQKLAAESGGALRLVRTSGQPPTQYVLEYHCPSLVRQKDGGMIITHRHQVEINLGSHYPFSQPGAHMLTPVFNPHVFSSNAICLGVVWNAAETLDTLVLKIGALLQLDPKVLDAHSPANSQANQWVQQNRSKIPLGNISFKTAAEPSNRIQWS
ncbi:MAG: ubiquitin-conjugating enzyme E2 [Chloroflexota bacterium]